MGRFQDKGAQKRPKNAKVVGGGDWGQGPAQQGTLKDGSGRINQAGKGKKSDERGRKPGKG